jgi:putative endonuclease
MDYVVYILFSDTINKFYVGQTQDIVNRMSRHNRGLENFTSKGVPWILKHTFSCKNRSEAIYLENKIKKRGIQRYLQDINLQ